MFVNSKQGYRVQESSGRLQETGRFAIEYLTHTIRMADFWGGAEVFKGKPIASVIGTGSYTGIGNCKDTWLVDPTTGLEGYTGASAVGSISNGIDTFPTGCIPSSSYVLYSDVLAIRYANPDGYVLGSQISGGISSSDPLATNGTYYVRAQGGTRAVIFDATSTSSTTSAFSSSTGISGSETSAAVLNYQYSALVFYLQNATYGSKAPTLYALQMEKDALVAEPIADGVEMMKFEYGLDSGTTDSPNYVVGKWIPADSVSASTAPWWMIRAVRVSLIVRGDALDNYKDNQTYYMTSGTSSSAPFCYGPQSSSCTAKYTGNERYQRRLLVKEIQIRNRLRG